MPFYAVRVGRQPGIYSTWQECKDQIDGVTARYKKFDTMEEAEKFLNDEKPGDHKKKSNNANNGDSKAEQSGGVSKDDKGSKRKHDVNQSDDIKKLKSESSDNDPRLIVYTDGCCYFNGKQGIKAGIGVYWGEGDKRNLSEPLKGTATKQRAELNAAIRALETAIAAKVDKIELQTDSIYTMNAMTSWMTGWKKRGFKTSKGEDVKNKEDMMKLDELCQQVDVKWVQVRSDSLVQGNEKADELAKTGSKSYVAEKL